MISSVSVFSFFFFFSWIHKYFLNLFFQVNFIVIIVGGAELRASPMDRFTTRLLHTLLPISPRRRSVAEAG